MPVYLVIIIMFGLPALLVIRGIIRENHKKRRNLKLAMAYERLVLENRLSIEGIDIFKNKVIALDRKNKKLVLIHHTYKTQQELCIPLLQIAACSIIEERDQQDQCIKKIFLNLKLRNLIQHLFCFYDDSKDDVMELPTLSRQAVNWSRSINIHRYPGNIGIEQEYMV